VPTSVLGHQTGTRAPPRFRVLGEVTVDGQRVGPAQERAVLAVLLLHAQHVVTTDALVDALWGEAPPKSALHSIQVHISELRRRLGASSIETTPTGYRLTVDPVDIDWCRFEQSVLDAEKIWDLPVKRLRLAEALSLWNGDPIEDVQSHLACDVGEQRLLELRLVALERWARASLRLGESAGLIPELSAVAHEHPLHEPLWACLIEALASAGRQPDALHAFAQLSANLAEVGLEPTAELRALEERVLLSDLDEPASRSRLPRRVGRRVLGLAAAILATVALVHWWATDTLPVTVVVDPWAAERNSPDFDRLEQVASDLDVEFTFLEERDFLALDEPCVEDAPIVLIGLSTYDIPYGTDCPTSRFFALDMEPSLIDATTLPPNMTPVVIADQEAAFLAGAIAALESNTGTIGFIGGTPIPWVDRLLAGFEAGAMWADRSTNVVAMYLTDDTTPTGFAEAYDNPELGYAAAGALFAADADIIFHAAGGSGEGILDAIVASSTRPRPLRFIGVDADARSMVPPHQRPYVLTSVVTRLDVAIRTVVGQYMDGGVEEAEMRLGLSDGVVRISSSGAAVTRYAPTVGVLADRISRGSIEVPVHPTDSVDFLPTPNG
jgi:DNA-binding SARP family transcriptional activator